MIKYIIYIIFLLLIIGKFWRPLDLLSGICQLFEPRPLLAIRQKLLLDALQVVLRLSLVDVLSLRKCSYIVMFLLAVAPPQTKCVCVLLRFFFWVQKKCLDAIMSF